jgi:type IX secretion system PorP/SprF family membrane protein
VAVLLASDRAKQFGFQSTSLGLAYSYQARLSKTQMLRFGLQGGYLLRSFNFNRLTFADGIRNGGSSAENLGGGLNQGFPDFALGAMYYTQQFWLGASILHVTYPKLRWQAGSVLHTGFLYPQINVQAGGKISFKKGKWETGYLQPAAMLQWQQGLGQMTAGMNFAYYPVVVGLWYKGMPFGPHASLSQNTVTMLMGYRHKTFAVNYSYDWSAGGPLGDFGGAHEISIIMSPKGDYRYKGGKKWGNKYIECPARQ